MTKVLLKNHSSYLAIKKLYDKKYIEQQRKYLL